MIRFVLDITPQSCQSAFRVGVQRGSLMRWKDRRKVLYQTAVTILARKYAPRTPLEGPLCVDMVFVLPRPKCLCRSIDSQGLIPCDKRPDRDNLQKGSQDALSACGFWHDDAQIADGRISKFYAERLGHPRIEVRIDRMETSEALSQLKASSVSSSNPTESERSNP